MAIGADPLEVFPWLTILIWGLMIQKAGAQVKLPETPLGSGDDYPVPHLPHHLGSFLSVVSTEGNQQHDARRTSGKRTSDFRLTSR